MSANMPLLQVEDLHISLTTDAGSFPAVEGVSFEIARGETVVCMDINPHTADFSSYGDKVRVVRGDVTQFDDVIRQMQDSKADRVMNLSYNLGAELPPHLATKLNIVGMDNCFEAARIRECARKKGRPDGQHRDDRADCGRRWRWRMVLHAAAGCGEGRKGRPGCRRDSSCTGRGASRARKEAGR